ncbi:diacylglycerol kinase 4-like protein [Tanacetum coccineum]
MPSGVGVLLISFLSLYSIPFYPHSFLNIGMDAQVAYGFHHLRNKKPYLAQDSGYSCKQGWFFTPCMAEPSLRGLKNSLRLHVKRLNSSEWELVLIPSRSIVALNLHSYASGRNPWGILKPDYMENKGFIEANADDGLLEVFGFKQGWHASFVMVELISAKHIAQACEFTGFELRGGSMATSIYADGWRNWSQPLQE